MWTICKNKLINMVTEDEIVWMVDESGLIVVFVVLLCICMLTSGRSLHKIVKACITQEWSVPSISDTKFGVIVIKSNSNISVMCLQVTT